MRTGARGTGDERLVVEKRAVILVPLEVRFNCGFKMAVVTR